MDEVYRSKSLGIVPPGDCPGDSSGDSQVIHSVETGVMRRGLLLACLVLPLLPGLSFGQRGGRNLSRQTSAQFGWHSSYARGLEEARAENRPVMLVFRCVP